MRKVSVICLMLMLGFMFTQEVYPDGPICKYEFNFSGEIYLNSFHNGIFNYGNEMDTYSSPSIEDSSMLFDYPEIYNRYTGKARFSIEDGQLTQGRFKKNPSFSPARCFRQILAAAAWNVLGAVAGYIISAGTLTFGIFDDLGWGGSS